ncbi:uncharacterized protein LOC132310332 [Cornus florida]|uniref:uncharacterized protein LOC132310332 n=1 Tax=Cornus florida TaxID=4283 RepID=UPI00289B1C20|nr:uncharacterized protein LOC132310332 [Cornus florida]
MKGDNFLSKSQAEGDFQPFESRVSTLSITRETINRSSNSQTDCWVDGKTGRHSGSEATLDFMSQQMAAYEECDAEKPQCSKKMDEEGGFINQQMASTQECDIELPQCKKDENDENGGFVGQQMDKPEEINTKLAQHTREEYKEKSGFIGQQMAKSEECDTELHHPTGEVNDDKKEMNASHQKLGKYFYYDLPHPEETGAWIPVSVPAMSESEHEEWIRGFSSNGGYFPDGEIGWSQYVGEDKELTMWDVVVEMLLVARGKVRSFAHSDIHKISWTSSHLVEQAWKEMAQTLTEANFGDAMEILEAEPPKWLPDSAAAACMLCSVRFHPIMCTRHHCRFCGGIFCSDCSRGRSLLPARFRVGDPQRVCDVCCVRLESFQPYLMDQVSHAAQLATHDLTDLSTLRSWVNFPWGQSMEYEIYKATNTVRGYNTVGSLRPEKLIPDAILRQAKGLAILTVVKVGMMVSYNIGTGLVVARREDGSWSPPSAISSLGVSWGAQAGGELTDFIVVLRTDDAVRTFSGDVHLSIGAGLSAAVGIVGRTFEADVRAGDGGYAACYTYSCSKGAFVGCSLGGSIVTTRTRENSRFYGSHSINASDVLLGSLPRPPAAAVLYRALADLYHKFEG